MAGRFSFGWIDTDMETITLKFTKNCVTIDAVYRKWSEKTQTTYAVPKTLAEEFIRIGYATPLETPKKKTKEKEVQDNA